ncbi:MAG: hypothetical protein ACUVS7_14860, partial [Bryobacteraceae bacterium]
PRVQLHYEWYNRLTSGKLPRGCRRDLAQAEAWEYEIPALDGSRPSSRVQLRRLRWQRPPSPRALHEDLDAFYSAAQSLFEKARQVDVGGLCRDKLELPSVEPLLTGEKAEDAAYRHLRAVREKNSVTERSRRVCAFLECLRETRCRQGIWLTPAERKQALHGFCERHDMTLDEFAVWRGISRSSVYNFQRGKMSDRTSSYENIRRAILEDKGPTDKELGRIRQRKRTR